jgi:hypothetical protein
MTREEFKTVLASKPNKLAGKLIEAIRATKPLSEIRALVEAGAATVYYERNPSKPRSSFLTHYVLDTCFESRMDVQRSSVSDGIRTAVIGPVHESEGREEAFRYLLSLRDPVFEPGNNNHRGHLFRHIFRSCFYRASPMRDQARKFAKVLVESGRADINFYAANDYGWNDHLESLETLIELGADPKAPGVLDCALNYVGCSPTHPYTSEDRVAVIKRLLELGATPTADLKLDRAVSWQNIRHTLDQGGLLPQFVQFGVISETAPEGYSRWLEYQTKAA